MVATTKLDWDADVPKHYVRRFAWLPAAAAQFEASRSANREPSYFTFCASNAIDVFLFLKEGVISRTPATDVVFNTYFYEARDVEFNRISQLIGAHEQGFLGGFQDIILFEDDDNTRALEIGDTARRFTRQERRLLNIKERHQRFAASIPFDVINLDVYGAFFPPAGGATSPMVRSIRKLLDMQSEAAESHDNFRSFTLFLTAHVEAGRVNDKAFSTLVEMVEKNRDDHAGFADALSARFGTMDVSEIADDNFNGFYCLSLPKLIVRESFDRGWGVTPTFSGLYSRQRTTSTGVPSQTYAMLSWVGKFERRPPDPIPEDSSCTSGEAEYHELITRVIDQPQDIDQAAIVREDEIKADLEQVVALRDSYQDRVRSRM